MKRRTHYTEDGIRPGQALLLSTVLLAVVMSIVGAFINYLGSVNKATETFTGRAAARQAASAGIDKALWCLNQGDGGNCGGTFGGDYAGEIDVPVGSDTWFTTTVTSVSGNSKTIIAVGKYFSATDPKDSVTLKADASINTSEASFFYGVQSGNGGFEMSNGAHVDGNLYSNGSVTGAPGSYVTGDVWIAGGTALSADQVQITNNEDFIFSRMNPVTDIAQSFKISEDNVVNKLSLYIKKTGSPANKAVIIVENAGGQPSKTVIGSGTLIASQITETLAWVDVAFSTPPALVAGQTYWFIIDGANNSTKYFTIGSQTNNGYGNGIGMSSVAWNASPPVWSDAGRDFTFKIWLGGVATFLQDIEVYGDAHANTINGAVIDGDAYYQIITSSSVGGTAYPGSDDPPPVFLPISEGLLAQWQTEASAGGTILGDVTYDGTTNTLGPMTITGNLTVTNGASLTLTGTIYVQGSVTLNNNSIIQLDTSYGVNSGILMSDGKVIVNNNVSFYGSGDPDSYLLVLSDDGSLDSANPAMDLSNNSENSIFYASKGVIVIHNNAILKEVTAFKIFLDNNASVQYESGLANVNFSSGPGGSWVMKAGSQREIH